MAFLAPLFLVGLIGVAIPILVHLIRREQNQVTPFPSLMFLRRIPYQAVRQRRSIRNLILLLVRLTAFVLIVIAFARPFFTGAASVMVEPGAREVVVLLDGSYSMGYSDHWPRALSAAKDVIQGLNQNDRASLLLFTSNVEILARSTSESNELLSALDAVELSAGATRYGPALQVAGSILAESSFSRREVILISDFQRSGWKVTNPVVLPAGTTLNSVVVDSESEQLNATVTTVSLDHLASSTQDRISVTATLFNQSEHAMKVSVALDIGDREFEVKQVDIDGQSTELVTFAPLVTSVQNMLGTVRLSKDALERDNIFHFLVKHVEPIHVLVIGTSGTSGSSSLYIRQALSVGERPGFEVVEQSAESIEYEDLRQSSVVVLNDARVMNTLAVQLQKYVEDGGGLLVVLGPRATWPTEVADILPVTFGVPVDRIGDPEVRIGSIQSGHTIFEPFQVPRSGDFSVARVYGYRSSVAHSSSQVLAEFDTGLPALVERQVGNGRVLAWLSTLDLQWSDLPLKPVFLPFVHRMSQYLAAYVTPDPWLFVGQALNLNSVSVDGHNEGPNVMLTPSGLRLELNQGDTEVVELTEQGFYEIRNRLNANASTVVASNIEVSESDLTPMDPEEMLIATRANTEGFSTNTMPQTREIQGQTQQIWWYLLCMGVFMLALDTVLSNLLSKA